MDSDLVCRTYEEWAEQVCEFRDRMGELSIMRDKDRRAALVKGFGIIYLRLRLPLDDEARAVITFEACVTEFTTRSALIDVMPEVG